MLRQLVRERLLAAADEIFGLFEKNIAFYEEQLCRAREETERQRRQLEDVYSAQVVIRLQDVEQLIGGQGELPPQPQGGSSNSEQAIPQRPQVKEEEEEADVSKLPLNAVSVKSEDDKAPECSQLHHHSPSGDHCGGPPPDDLLAPLSDSDDGEEHLTSDADRRGDNKLSKYSGKETETPSQTHATTSRRKNTFVCSVCYKMFVLEESLSRHMKTHMAVKPFGCSMCCKRFTSKGGLVQHARTHTGEKPFGCSTCGKRFNVKDTLVQHMRTHTGEKPYSCSTCGKAFSQKHSQVTHMRKHRGERPFGCLFCEKKYTSNHEAVAHVRTHTGENMYSCSVCGVGFTQKAALIAHVQDHNQVIPPLL